VRRLTANNVMKNSRRFADGGDLFSILKTYEKDISG